MRFWWFLLDAIARSMVVEYGMSDLGPMNFGPQYESSDYGTMWGKPFEISDSVQAKVDEEISQLINKAQLQSTQLLKKYQKQLDIIALKLLEVETLDADEFTKLMGMEKFKPDILK